VTPSEFLEKWSSSAAAERSNAQSFVIDLCAILNVDPPTPPPRTPIAAPTSSKSQSSLWRAGF